jgi:hypothetical protein
MEYDIGYVADPELHAVIALQRFALHPFAVDESSVLAALVHHAKLSVFGGDQSMVAGDARVGDDQVLIDLSPYCERSMVEINCALVVALHENQCRENPRSWGRSRARDRLQSHVSLDYFPKLSTTIEIESGRQEYENTGSSNPATQGCERLLLIVKDFKNRSQLGNLQHVAQALTQARELDIGTGSASGREDPHQSP